MWDFSIGNALRLVSRTLPFIVFRVLVYFGISAAFVIATGIGAGLGWGIGVFGDDGFQAGATGWGAVLGFGLAAGVLFLLRAYLLYIVKAGHIAVMVELMEGRDIPQGQRQIAYAVNIVRERFVETNVLFGLDQLIKGVLAAIVGLVQGVASLLPIPGLQNFVGLFRAFLRLSVGLADELILGWLIRSRAVNPWEASQVALVLYAQNYKVMLRNAAWLTLFTYILALVVFLVMLAPAAALAFMLPNAWGAGAIVFALLFAWAVKAALIEPFALAAMLSVYFRTVEGQSPDPEWTARIAGVSRKFRKLGEKAANWVGPRAPTTDFTAPGGPVT
jgi:hypothetical protein